MEILPSTPVATNASTPDTPDPSHSSSMAIEETEVLNALKIQRKTENSQLIANHIYQQFSSNQWVDAGLNAVPSVCVRIRPRDYAIEPVPPDTRVLEAVKKIDVKVACLMRSKITECVFRTLQEGDTGLVFPRDGVQVQILESLDEIIASTDQTLRKFQYVCFLRQERAVLLWHDNVRSIFKHAEQMNTKMMSLLWGRDLTGQLYSSTVLELKSPRASVYSMQSSSTFKLPWKVESSNLLAIEESKGAVSENVDIEKTENTAVESPDRPAVYTSSIYTGIAIFIMTVLLFGGALRTLVVETAIDGQYIRLALAITLPFSGSLALFFFLIIVTDVCQLIGPVRSTTENSRFYSARSPCLGQAFRKGFQPPHITIQMPVYKESLQAVLQPTIQSLRQAVSHYELHGGTASIFVNDDGMQLIDSALAKERREFYQDNGIGWVARPRHGENGYLRAGKFKKASNMNFGLEISNKTEDTLLELIDARDKTGYNPLLGNDIDELYNAALEKVIEEDTRVWASGNIRTGEIILIVDSDTRVPADCLIYGAAEMFLNPEVAIIQHSAGVMQVVEDYFENGITYFTNLIYSAIRFVCGSGDVAPFVGHNAFLRWQAVQSVSFRSDNREYYWSESHVSEDFDMALRLQVAGNVVRLATYHGLHGFQEGVSLTIYDELARWEKYAYGCNELVFNPIHAWPWRGPFSKLFIQFLSSDIQLCSKISVLGYILSYYAIAIGLPFGILNYTLLGWYNGYFDSFYLDSWKVFLSLVVVFSFLGNLSLAVLRYRVGEKALLAAIMENFKWMPVSRNIARNTPLHFLTSNS
ncbi:hypothetical protein TWF718_004757 [Orbilia javanica]|uniref:Glycosyltransferase 2-like domain-containing protein n=1 Tax=Orbilia javanica TaxID=47235 RepID=A0AAN8NC10_9PEZI